MQLNTCPTTGHLRHHCSISGIPEYNKYLISTAGNMHAKFQCKIWSSSLDNSRVSLNFQYNLRHGMTVLGIVILSLHTNIGRWFKSVILVYGSRWHCVVWGNSNKNVKVSEDRKTINILESRNTVWHTFNHTEQRLLTCAGANASAWFKSRFFGANQNGISGN